MLIAQRPTLTEDVVNDYRSRFTIEPLEPGFGYTLGNSLRRTLLSSIPGASVTSIRIDGVLHEFSTIPGVVEDVTEVILNLKSLVVSSEHDEPVTMYLRKQGPGAVAAADIAPPAGVEVHNSGRGARYTAGRRPVRLVYVEVFDAIGEALRRERQLKRLAKAEKEALVASARTSRKKPPAAIRALVADGVHERSRK